MTEPELRETYSQPIWAHPPKAEAATNEPTPLPCPPSRSEFTGEEKSAIVADMLVIERLLDEAADGVDVRGMELAADHLREAAFRIHEATRDITGVNLDELAAA